MHIILLKFYDKYWKPYFDDKTYNNEEAKELYNHLIHSYPDSQWMLIEIKEKHIKEV